MPKLILRCNYLKNAPPSHLENYINYISTREGVEKVGDTTGLLPATAKQKEIIEDILSRIDDASRMHEYYDYIQNPTRENASEFITQALENNLDIVAKKKNYIDYLANRPGAERIGSHGLFSNEGESIVLSKVAEEVAGHSGVIWTNVISLRREDAERLGYDSAAQWQTLIQFEEPYEVEERAERQVAYADRQEIEEEIIRRYLSCDWTDEIQGDVRSDEKRGGMAQTQVDEVPARVRQTLRTGD